MRLDINYKEKTVRKTNTWRSNNTFLNNQQITKEIKREIKNFSKNKWQRKHDNSKPMGCCKSSSKIEVYSNTILPQETSRTPNRQLKYTSKATGEKMNNKNNNKNANLIEGRKS